MGSSCGSWGFFLSMWSSLRLYTRYTKDVSGAGGVIAQPVFNMIPASCNTQTLTSLWPMRINGEALSQWLYASPQNAAINV